ncbi:MAG TPA: tRNA adenosine(34) deaminase TadA [bacterium]|nr:tRNA adenosine(34) deaminase TadA [bacterium]
MRLALREAAKAARRGEVPVGAVLVNGDQVLARGYNTREQGSDPTAHAEIHAIRRAAKRLGSWRLSGSTLVVTLEPCIQCIGAALLARVETVVFGCRDPKGGALGSVVDLRSPPNVNHSVKVIEGVLAEECSAALTDFFRELRQKKKKKS